MVAEGLFISVQDALDILCADPEKPIPLPKATTSPANTDTETAGASASATTGKNVGTRFRYIVLI
jgi:hypothetical protein